MEKQGIFHLSGVQYHFADDAYTIINQYFATIDELLLNHPQASDIRWNVEKLFASSLSLKCNPSTDTVSAEQLNVSIQNIGTPEAAIETVNTNYSGAPFNRPPKKLYRDTLNKAISGVCAGLVHYIHVDLTLLRILFAVFFILSSGSFGLVYILLWIFVPEAKSAHQRLEMKGEPASAENLNAEESAFEAKSKSNTNPESYPEDFYASKKKSGNFFTSLLKVIAWIIGGFFLFIFVIVFGSIALSIFGVAIGASVLSFIIPEVFMFNQPAFLDPSMGHLSSNTVLGMVLFIGAPILFVLFLISKALYKHKAKGIWAFLLCLALWFIGAGILSRNASQIFKHASNMDITVDEDDEGGYLIIDGDTVVRYNESGVSNHRHTNIPVKDFSFKQSATYNSGDTILLSKLTPNMENEDYSWVTPKVYLRNGIDGESVSMEIFLKGYPLQFKKFELTDPNFNWNLHGKGIAIQEQIGIKKDIEALPRIILTLPQNSTLEIENGFELLISNLDSIKGTSQNAKYYQFTDGKLTKR